MSEKQYEIYWQELQTHVVYVTAESPEEAFEIYKDGDYDGIEYGVEVEAYGDISIEEQG